MKLHAPKINITENADGSEATILFEALNKGMGQTLGNDLRRMLLSELPGFAAIGVKIDGVSHPSSVIPGVREDVTDVIMNVKGLCFKGQEESYLSDEERIFTARLEGSTPGPLCGKDLVCGEGITVANPNHPICTLDANGRISMEITIGNGRGYRESKENVREDAPIDYIPIDSIFTPVRFASYAVEASRVGQSIDYDKLTLSVKTNGSLSAKDAVALASKILIDHLYLSIKLCAEIAEMEPCLESEEEKDAGSFDQTPIEELDLSVRAYNCLKRAGIHRIGELLTMTSAQLLKLRNFGSNSLAEVERKLSEKNLQLSGSDRSEE